MPKHKTGVILVNLGTPESPTPASVRRFLRAFLSDRRVVDAPRILWFTLLNLVILPLRSRKVAQAYASIWTERGSPLREFSRELAETLSRSINAGSVYEDANNLQESDPNVQQRNPVGDTLVRSTEITWALTYGEPAIETRLKEFTAAGIDRILMLPLYPQFSSTTTAPVYDRVLNFYKFRKNIPDVRWVHDYYDHPAYINALALSVKEHWRREGRKERLLMSFHGLPINYVDAGDPYIQQCEITASLLAEKLSLEIDEWVCSFQSRFGPKKWVQPYTNEVLIAWAEDDIKNINVICPSFATDCLETLEEVGQQYTELYRQAGGIELSLIPCLNSTQIHVQLLVEIIKQNSW